MSPNFGQENDREEANFSGCTDKTLEQKERSPAVIVKRLDGSEPQAEQQLLFQTMKHLQSMTVTNFTQSFEGLAIPEDKSQINESGSVRLKDGGTLRDNCVFTNPSLQSIKKNSESTPTNQLSPQVSPKCGLGAGPPSFAELNLLRKANPKEGPSMGDKPAKAVKEGMMFGDQIQEGEDELESTAP